jgi:hypothetical protein
VVALEKGATLEIDDMPGKKKKKVIANACIDRRVSGQIKSLHAINSGKLGRQTRVSEASKRVRRKASEIDRKFLCPRPGCGKRNGRGDSLNLHIRLKHKHENPQDAPRESAPQLPERVKKPRESVKDVVECKFFSVVLNTAKHWDTHILRDTGTMQIIWTDVHKLLKVVHEHPKLVGNTESHLALRNVVKEGLNRHSDTSLTAAAFRKTAGQQTRDFKFVFGKEPCAYCSQCKRFQPWTCFSQRRLKGKGGKGSVVGYFRCTMLASKEGTKNKTVEVAYEETQEKRYSTCMACARPELLKNKVGLLPSPPPLPLSRCAAYLIFFFTPIRQWGHRSSDINQRRHLKMQAQCSFVG